MFMCSKVYVKIRRHPDRVSTYRSSREIAEKRKSILTDKQVYSMTQCIGQEIMNKEKGTTFGGRVRLTERELNYMIECAKEARKRKTW